MLTSVSVALALIAVILLAADYIVGNCVLEV